MLVMLMMLIQMRLTQTGPARRNACRTRRQDRSARSTMAKVAHCTTVVPAQAELAGQFTPAPRPPVG